MCTPLACLTALWFLSHNMLLRAEYVHLKWAPGLLSLDSFSSLLANIPSWNERQKKREFCLMGSSACFSSLSRGPQALAWILWLPLTPAVSQLLANLFVLLLLTLLPSLLVLGALLPRVTHTVWLCRWESQPWLKSHILKQDWVNKLLNTSVFLNYASFTAIWCSFDLHSICFRFPWKGF